MSHEFKRQFRAARTIKPEASSLTNIKQQTDEILKVYLARFNLEVVRARGVDDISHLMAIRAGILTGSQFWEDLQRKLVYNLAEFAKCAQRCVNLEEARSQLSPDAAASKRKNPDHSLGQKQHQDA